MAGSAYFAREESIWLSRRCHLEVSRWRLRLKSGGKTAALQNAPAPPLASFGFGLLGGLGCYGLIDLEEGHFQFAEEIEEEGVFLGG